MPKIAELGQKMKNWNVQEETDEEAKDKKQSFGEDSKKAWYKGSI